MISECCTTNNIKKELEKELNIRRIPQEDETIKEVFEVKVFNKDCFYTDCYKKAIEVYNQK